MFFRELSFETKYFFQEIWLAIKHPSRKQTYIDIYYHWLKIWNILLFHPIYCLKRGIRNFWIWKGIIWGNDCFDYTFLLNVMDRQLKDMEEFFLSDKTVALHAKQRGKRIKWTRKLQQMWLDEHYTMIEYYKHKEKFPNEPSMFEHDEEDITRDEYGVPILYRCKPSSEESSADYRVHSDIGRKMDEKVYKLYFKNLATLRGWWD